MSGKRVSDMTGDEVRALAGGQESPVGQMVTVEFIPKAWAHLLASCKREGLSVTDILNRAATLYEFVSGELAAGRVLLLRDDTTGETQLVRIL